MIADPEFFSNNWCSLSWSDWIPLEPKISLLRDITKLPGVYRVRPRKLQLLAYIGETGMGLRGRLSMLATNIYSNLMPYNDPHTAAPNFWVLRTEEGMAFECSAAQTDLPKNYRRGLEDMLLWKYRIEFGESTLCNHGRFHQKYEKSRGRKSGRRGRKLPPGELNPAGGPSASPLQLIGRPEDANWMGLSWSILEGFSFIKSSSIPKAKGLYKIIDKHTHQLLYIGETKNLRDRIASYVNHHWKGYEPTVSYHLLNADMLDHQLRELETDLLGGYFFSVNRPPEFQYGKLH